jgi:hypothetical protein
MLARGEFKDEGASESGVAEFLQDPWPINVAVSGRKVVIAVPAVVVDVDEVEAAEKLLNDRAKLTGKERVSGVQADAHLAGGDAAQEVKHVVDVPEKQVGEHVLQHEIELECAAALGDVVEGFRGIAHALKELCLGRTALALGSRVKDNGLNVHRGSRFASDDKLVHGRGAQLRIQRGDVDARREGGMEGKGSDAQITHFFSGSGDIG